MMDTIRLTAAQAMTRWLSVQMNDEGQRFIDGVWAIFGHGNVAGIGEALYGVRNSLPTWRGQNEQTMAHAAIAFAKGRARRQAQAVTTSIGPGATNVVTAAALAHVNRLPLLVIAGDVFASRRPDPVLQQVEDWTDGTVTANDCFRPVGRYFDRIMRPEQLLTALPRSLRVMTDPADCGPAVLAFCQDVQTQAYEWPVDFFLSRIWHIRRPEPDAFELIEAVRAIRAAKHPVIVAGGGVIYARAETTLADFASRHNIPVIETQAGKSALAQSHPMNYGAAGVDGSGAANAVAKQADLIIALGTRLQDFTSGSRTLFSDAKIIGVNVQPYDAAKHGAMSLVSDADVALGKLTDALGDYRAGDADPASRATWLQAVDIHCATPTDMNSLPTDAQVIGAAQRAAAPDSIAMCAAGTMPGALKLLWKPAQGGYHMEYGYSCMGYEIAGAMGLKLARPDREVLCFVGDGSYMMANSELATAVMRRVPFIVILTDNRGFGCINRLQKGTGGEPFNNLYIDSNIETQPQIDFVAHAASMGACAVKADNITDLELQIRSARGRDIPTVIVIETTPRPGPGDGLMNAGYWWDVAVPETGSSDKLKAVYADYLRHAARQSLAN